MLGGNAALVSRQHPYHTLNSDGNASPDATVRWYREHGYQFVVITDHEFYASNEITLEDYAAGTKEIAITIKQTTRLTGFTPDSRFLTRFIGKGGRILAEVPGLKPRYTFRGDEGYVRAAIIDSNGRRAWAQPVVLEASKAK